MTLVATLRVFSCSAKAQLVLRDMRSKQVALGIFTFHVFLHLWTLALQRLTFIVDLDHAWFEVHLRTTGGLVNFIDLLFR